MKRLPRYLFFLFLIVLRVAETAYSQTTEFVYQGQLQNSGSPATGNYDFEFLLYDSLSGGTQVGATLTKTAAPVASGIFSVKLDFGDVFPGANRFIEVHVRQTGGGAFTSLTPRQQLNSVPYAVKSLNAQNAVTAANATNASNSALLGGIASGGYIQNTSSQQASTNFNISGNGTVGATLTAAAVDSNIYKLLTQNALGTDAHGNFAGGLSGLLASSVSGGDNVAFGNETGASLTSGGHNSFFGTGSGELTTTGANNAFFGHKSGRANAGGGDNSFFGTESGNANISGSNNAFFGMHSGKQNTSGFQNSFFGRDAGRINVDGASNAFFGYGAGASNNASENTFIGKFAGNSNTTGDQNVFVGSGAAINNLIGARNTVVGYSAGTTLNTTFVGFGSNNTLIGYQANVNDQARNFATAIGAGAVASVNNSVTLGRASDTVIIPNTVSIASWPSIGDASVCRNTASGQLGNCTSSIRFKSNVHTFGRGLELLQKLRPVSFNWKESGTKDLGFVAEDVAAAEPLLATTGKDGEIVGVKYDRIGAVLVNAIKEQQAQIEAQAEQIAALQSLVCRGHRRAAACRKK